MSKPWHDWVNAYRPWRDESHLRELYHVRGMTLAEIAEALNVHFSTIHEWFDKLDIERRSSASYQTPELLTDAEWLREQHHEHGLDTKEIAELVGCGRGTIRNAFHRHGIEQRGKMGEATVSTLR